MDKKTEHMATIKVRLPGFGKPRPLDIYSSDGLVWYTEQEIVIEVGKTRKIPPKTRFYLKGFAPDAYLKFRHKTYIEVANDYVGEVVRVGETVTLRWRDLEGRPTPVLIVD